MKSVAKAVHLTHIHCINHSQTIHIHGISQYQKVKRGTLIKFKNTQNKTI
ncbi:MAG: hypothetical protein LBC61_04345 [Candidatus Peribacteria bacterium]|nr:hypothetical protein [Candidatus Peribacteria bacterium]